jgi:hypothetical protein
MEIASVVVYGMRGLAGFHIVNSIASEVVQEDRTGCCGVWIQEARWLTG